MEAFLILFILSGFVGIGIESFMKKKADSYLERLSNTGIARIKAASENRKVWKWMERHKYAEIFLSDYIISVKFYKKVLDYLEQQQVLSEDELQNCCLELASQFCVKHTGLLLKFLQQKELLFPFFSPTGEIYYISAEVMKAYEYLFEDE